MNPVKWAARRVLASDEEIDRRLSICEGCKWATMSVRGACKDCGKVQTVTSPDDSGLVCKKCSGKVEARKGVFTDFEMPRCGHCGCPLESRSMFKHSHCPKGKW